VGEGPFTTELLDATGETLRKVGGEFGVTTGRPRRCGWLDLVQLRYAHAINNFTCVNITKLDVLTGIPEIKGKRECLFRMFVFSSFLAVGLNASSACC
jgi:adenylosuccinate synthase